MGRSQHRDDVVIGNSCDLPLDRLPPVLRLAFDHQLRKIDFQELASKALGLLRGFRAS